MDRSVIGWIVAAALLSWTLLQPAARGFGRRRRARSRMRRAHQGEKNAETLLRRLGYRLVARQARRQWTVEIDGRRVPVELRADFLVAHGTRRLVAEVKTGDHAPNPAQTATRRQLLEYRFAFDADGILLVDPEAGRIREIGFSVSRSARGRGPSPAWSWALGVAVGAGATLIWTMTR